MHSRSLVIWLVAALACASGGRVRDSPPPVTLACRGASPFVVPMVPSALAALVGSDDHAFLSLFRSRPVARLHTLRADRTEADEEVVGLHLGVPTPFVAAKGEPWLDVGAPGNPVYALVVEPDQGQRCALLVVVDGPLDPDAQDELAALLRSVRTSRTGPAEE
jgi:hypothetical protein